MKLSSNLVKLEVRASKEAIIFNFLPQNLSDLVKNFVAKFRCGQSLCETWINSHKLTLAIRSRFLGFIRISNQIQYGTDSSKNKQKLLVSSIWVWAHLSKPFDVEPWKIILNGIYYPHLRKVTTVFKRYVQRSRKGIVNWKKFWLSLFCLSYVC